MRNTAVFSQAHIQQDFCFAVELPRTTLLKGGPFLASSALDSFFSAKSPVVYMVREKILNHYSNIKKIKSGYFIFLLYYTITLFSISDLNGMIMPLFVVCAVMTDFEYKQNLFFELKLSKPVDMFYIL